MNLKLLKLQASICGLLMLILVAEWGYGQFAERQLQQNLQASAADDVAADDLPTIGGLKADAETYNELVERPLFIQGRKPIVEAAANKPQTVESGQIEDWLLIGVYNKDDKDNKDKKTMALFAKKNEAKKYLKIGSEQTISGWTLKEIKPDRVILQQAGQEKSVMLRKPRPQNKMPVRPKPAQPKPAAQPQPANNNPEAQPNETNPENGNDDSETE